jgi:hypothetical protein
LKSFGEQETLRSYTAPSSKGQPVIAQPNFQELDMETLSQKKVVSQIVLDDHGNPKLSIIPAPSDKSNTTKSTTFDDALLAFLAMSDPLKKAAAAAAAAAVAQPSTTTSITTATTSSEQPAITSSPSPPPPQLIQVKYEDGLFVPQNGELFHTLTNTTDKSRIQYPIWVTVVDILGEWDPNFSGINNVQRRSSDLIRSVESDLKKKMYTYQGSSIMYLPEGEILRQEAQFGRFPAPDFLLYNATRERYRGNYNSAECRPDNLSACMKICETKDRLDSYIQDMKKKFPNLLQKSKQKKVDFFKRPYESSKYQWLPSEFKIDSNRNCEITSYINNLPISEKSMYDTISKLFESFRDRSWHFA